MPPPKRRFFQLLDIKGTADIVDVLAKQFSIERSGSWIATEQFFDSFDWRLFKNKLSMILSNNCLRVVDVDGQLLLETEVGEAQKFFCWDFPTTSSRELLQEVLGYRAVFPLVGVNKTVCDYRLTNKDKKIVVKISVIVYRAMAGEEEIAAFLDMRGVRGYDGQFKRAAKIVRHNGARETPQGPAVLEAVLQNGQRFPLDYSSKYLVALEAEWTVGQVASVICLALLDTMERNLEFILTDVDTEFLHDFRVAMRRTRSFLSLMKKLLPVQVANFVNDFKWLGPLTGSVRDLDVYLLKKDYYTSLLPKTLRAGLPYFFDDLARQRQQVFKEMVDGLRSDRFKTLMLDWRRYLAELPTGQENGYLDRPCRPEAVRLIHKQFVRIKRDGRKIDDSSADKLLHDLRLQAKKFRYLLEFYAPYFQRADVKLFVQQLKKLQDNLGDFNDLSVQQWMLEDYHAGLAGRSKRDLKIASAIGGLISNLTREQQLVRQDFKRIFKRFSKKDNIRLFHQTFRP